MIGQTPDKRLAHRPTVALTSRIGALRRATAPQAFASSAHAW
jgi:hypothetical protein